MMLKRLESETFSAVLIGEESLLIGCGERLLELGCSVASVISDNPDIRSWATGKGVPIDTMTQGLEDRLAGVAFDWLFSIANLKILPKAVLSLAAKSAINFHDGPLPRYAGINAPVWALLNGETNFGVTWHLIEDGIDEGRILAQRMFDIADGETAYSLNAKCYAAALDSFSELLSDLQTGTVEPVVQDLSQRSYFGRDQRPNAAGQIDFRKTTAEILALVRALDHGAYWNPLCCAKVDLSGRIVLVGTAEITNADQTGDSGTVLAVNSAGLTVATIDGAVRLEVLTDLNGASIDATALVSPGQALRGPDTEKATAFPDAVAHAVRGEPYWRARLQTFRPLALPLTPISFGDGGTLHLSVRLPRSVRGTRLIALLAVWALRSSGTNGADLALRMPETAAMADQAKAHLNDWVPMQVGAMPETEEAPVFVELERSIKDQLAAARKYPAIQSDLAARDPRIGALRVPDFGLNLCDGTLLPGTALTAVPNGDQIVLIGNADRIAQPFFHMLAERLELLISVVATGEVNTTAIDALPILPEAERGLVTLGLNRTARDYSSAKCLHQAFEDQVSRIPEDVALVFENQKFSYARLNACANRVAHVLKNLGVEPGVRVGIHTTRSPDMVIAALAILKTGAAYVPLDPAYPQERIGQCVADSGMSVIVTNGALSANLPPSDANVLELDQDTRIATAAETNIDSGVTGDDIAYLIYTSGSSGVPKGVQVRHQNVANFMVGMDDRIGVAQNGVWLALTSLSFDISVLEIFYTLARGYKVILSNDADRALVADAPIMGSDRKIDISLFYWGNDDGVGPKKYELLLEGAKFADTNGFCAVWTPERHFHAFGGPYPNPSVTGAAVAAVTKNIGVRAGSCVAPLHHPARIAEEWAVIDNLTNGRAGLAIASGWQPDDFVLRPENTPPENKPAMFRAIEDLRKLWRGEAVEFPTASGEPHAVVTQPRPVSKELPIWVTTAGNPETWKEAGSIGANILTHLLGQSIDEVGEKIELYHQALRDAGHDPADHTVTLMLHTLIGEDREVVRGIAREPMKDYLRSAAGLIKQYAWAFPAFKKPAGVSNPFQIDLAGLSDEEMDAILDFAFERYFEDSGLFGTKADCLTRVEELKRIGVDEVACLIDYGVATDQVMQGLHGLAEVLAEANRGTQLEKNDYSIAAQIHRHGVTHLQCTPSMARMLVTNDAARAALAKVETLMIGGEPLPNALARDLRDATKARLLNMYGPTETTIWSTVAEVEDAEAPISIGTPIANTRTYVLDNTGNPTPVGIAGELCIGGDGVTAGYWQRDDLTTSQFPPDPFVKGAEGGVPARMFRTGDLARWRADGQLECFGRIDTQIKLRGYRIEPGEIETALARLSGITEAVVVPQAAAEQDVRLVAYVTGNTEAPEAKIRDLLAGYLPAHMIPSKIIHIDAFPLTPNKKVDRKALAAIRPAVPELRLAETSVLDTDTEKSIATIWAQVLGVTRVGSRDNFFALGGHSLLAVQVHRKICAAMGPGCVSITDIFAHPTLRGLAEQIDARRTDTRPEIRPEKPQKHVPETVISDRRALRARREMQNG